MSFLPDPSQSYKDTINSIQLQKGDLQTVMEREAGLNWKATLVDSLYGYGPLGAKPAPPGYGEAIGFRCLHTF